MTNEQKFLLFNLLQAIEVNTGEGYGQFDRKDFKANVESAKVNFGFDYYEYMRELKAKSLKEWQDKMNNTPILPTRPLSDYLAIQTAKSD